MDAPTVLDLYTSDHTVTGKTFDDILLKASEELKQYGVCIIPSLLTDPECEDLENETWKMLEEMSAKWAVPISKDDPKTWDMTNFFPLHHMLLQQLVSHSQVTWSARQNPKVVQVFQHLWKNQDLVTSFDGMSIHFPPEKTGIKKDWYNPRLQKNWIHCDQSYYRNDLECYQSWITPLDVNAGDATLIYLDGSHQHHGKFANDMKEIDKGEWYVLSKYDIEKYESYGCRLKAVTCPKGSLVLWVNRPWGGPPGLCLG